MDVLLIVILSFILLGYLLRFLAPILLKWYVKRMQKRFGFTQNRSYSREEGEVTINKTAQNATGNKTNATKDVGDYVDFEEVK